MKTAVLINNYNHAAWLPACLDSVLAQSHPADEIVVYDDASTDNGLAVLKQYESRITVIAGPRPDPQIPPYIRQGNAIHQAFLRTTADVLFLLDSDDVFDPVKIEQYLPAFSRVPQPALVQAPMRWIDSQGRKKERYPEPYKHTPDPLATTYASNDPDLFYPTSALAFSRSFLNRALPIDWSDKIPLWSDTRLSLAALLHGPVITLPDELGSWRHHASSDSAHQSRSRAYQSSQTRYRTKVFNHLACQLGKPTISLWRNRRFCLQLVRLLMPPQVFRIYQHYFVKIPRSTTVSSAGD